MEAPSKPSTSKCEGSTEHKEEEAYGNHEAGDDHQESVLDTANVGTGLKGGRAFRSGVGLLSFHNLNKYF